MKIALASARIVDRDIEHNLKQMERFMRQAKAENATLVCFGEAFLQGFGALTWNYEKDREIAISTSSKEFSYIKSLTKSIGIDVMFGYNELSGDRIYSSCALVSGGEIVHNYRRISRGWKEYWKTDDHYREGSSVEIFEYGNKKCAIALCGDLWDHPERFALGEDVLFWGVYVSWTSEEWENGGRNEYAEQAAACCENTLYFNSLTDGDAFGGAAHFLGGKINSELPITHEGILCVII